MMSGLKICITEKFKSNKNSLYDHKLTNEQCNDLIDKWIDQLSAPRVYPTHFNESDIRLRLFDNQELNQFKSLRIFP